MSNICANYSHLEQRIDSLARIAIGEPSGAVHVVVEDADFAALAGVRRFAKEAHVHDIMDYTLKLAHHIPTTAVVLVLLAGANDSAISFPFHHALQQTHSLADLNDQGQC